MAENVKVPGIGEVDKRYVWAGVAIVGGIVAYAWWRRTQTAASGGPVVDPATGSLDGGGGYVNPAPGGRSADNPIDNGASDIIDTNHEWASDVATRLSSSWEPTFVLTVLGKYLAGVPLTPQEADVARAAIGIAGMPPEGAPPIVLVRVEQPPPTGGGDDDDDTPPPPPPPPPPPAGKPPLPDSAVVPAFTNLYHWSQGIEAQYSGITRPIFDVIRGQGSLYWAQPGMIPGLTGDPSEGNIPHFRVATTVRLR